MKLNLTPEQISVDDNLLRNPILSIFSIFFSLPLWIGSSFTCYNWQRGIYDQPKVAATVFVDVGNN